MKANFAYTFKSKDKEGNTILSENGKPVYKSYYTLSGTTDELQAYSDWRTSQEWQVKRNEQGSILMVGRPCLDLNKGKLYSVKSGQIGGKFTYWVDFSEVTQGIASCSAADYYGDADFTSEVRKQIVAELRGASVSQFALSAVAEVAKATPNANLNEPLADSE